MDVRGWGILAIRCEENLAIASSYRHASGRRCVFQ
jgi:hypothetical protein